MDRGLRDVQNRSYTIENPSTRTSSTGVIVASSIAVIAALVVGMTSAALILDEPPNYYMSESYLATRDAALVRGVIDSAFPPTATATGTATPTIGPSPTRTPTPLPRCKDEDTVEGTVCVMLPGDYSRTPTPYPTMTPTTCPNYYPQTVDHRDTVSYNPLVCIKPDGDDETDFSGTPQPTSTQHVDVVVAVPTNVAVPTMEVP